MNAPLRGFTALLLHAFPLDARMWDETRSELGEVAVVAPTLPPEGGGRTLSGWAAAVLAQPESAPAAATARSEAPLMNVPVACVPP